MPPKSKRVKQLQAAALHATESRKRPRSDEDRARTRSPRSSVASDADSAQDPSFDPEEELRANPELKLEEFVEDWVLTLSRDDKISLGLFLFFHFQRLLSFTQEKAAEYAQIMTGRSERTVRQWARDFLEHGEIPENKQGKYQRTGVLWSSEELNDKATKFVRENAAVRGRPKMTAISFSEWVNEDLLPNSNLEPGFPRKVSSETARKWLYELGFDLLKPSKGMFFDGHEREDVVAYRQVFLRRMIDVGFLHPEQAPTPEAAAAFPHDVPLPRSDVREKAVVFFHDESTFHVNEDQPFQWGEKGNYMLRPKSKGSGIMVSDFVDERNGYLALTDAEFEAGKRSNPNLQQQALTSIEYGESREGYWTSEKFMKQMEKAVQIAEVKYPKCDNWRHIWVFDSSSCHTAKAPDSLEVSRMNVNPGGKQKVMRDTVWAGKVQTMNYALGIPKGMRVILQERGINPQTLNADQMRTILSQHDDFRNEKSRVEQFLDSKGHTTIFLPKFHPELNPIERVWAQSKRYTKAYCKYNLQSLRKNIPLGLQSVSAENIANYHRKVRHYMISYLEGHVAGAKLEQNVAKYKIAVKSHRRIGINE